MRALILLTALTLPAPTSAQAVDKQVLVTVTAAELKGGVVSEIAWDNGAIVLQGVFALPDGTLSPQYFVTPTDSVSLRQLTQHTEASARYWEMKARTVSPTGMGRITMDQDAKVPMYGIASQEQRMHDAVVMGGTRKHIAVRLGRLTLHERASDVLPYDGEVWSWSPAELNRIAYVDAHGDLWVARADGANARRILRGDFTLPAWSDNGQVIAVAERKHGGKTWEISIVHLPPALRDGR